MPHDNTLGLPDPRDERPSGLVTLVDTAFVAFAAVSGIALTTFVATLVAPLGAGLGFVALFVGWPFGFLVAVLTLRAGYRTAGRTGVLTLARTLVKRVRTSSRVAADGGQTDDVPCN